MSKVVKIGGVARRVRESCGPISQAKVPRGYLRELRSDGSGYFLSQLRWMLQKHNLDQDIFLIGSPGKFRKSLALSFCELLNLEAEVVTLSRDVTESDLKQRREIRQGNLVFEAMPPLSAALEGKVLILDGIEKAERNVLPVLNNLLENREMTLLDGRRLVSAKYFDDVTKQMKISPKEARENLGLERAHEDFRCVALGLPVPHVFPGFPLDPPLRSRFQSKFIEKPVVVNDPRVSALVESLRAMAASGETANRLLHTAEGIEERMVQTMKLTGDSLQEALHKVYPWKFLLRDHKEQRAMLQQLLKRFQEPENVAEMEVFAQDEKDLFLTLGHRLLLQKMQLDPNHICLIGSRGSGKSAIANLLAESKTRRICLMHCFKDMTARDLTQRRFTKEDKSTLWKNSALVEAAINGEILILDGVDLLESDTLASIQQLLHHGEMQLPNGDRLLSAANFDSLSEKPSFVYRVHPDFKVIALARPPTSGTKGNDWLSAEVQTIFQFYKMPMFSRSDLLGLLEFVHVDAPKDAILSIIKGIEKRKVGFDFVQGDETQELLQLSLRQTLRIVRLCLEDDRICLNDVLRRNLMVPFQTQAIREAFEEDLPDDKPLERFGMEDIEPFVTDAKSVEEFLSLIPKVQNFVDMPHQIQFMCAAFKDLEGGSNVLLIGNQGTGKNKLIDRLLELVKRPREYLQLSRDSSVQSLTSTAVLEEGNLKYIDSPLVRAARNGHVLVLDEADKAAVEVLSVLKGLLADGELLLSDGRRISRNKENANIVLHDDFRVVCLANRPGFPFLGNDFFAELGDVFAPHIIDNGSLEDQKLLVRALAPSLPDEHIEALTKAFSRLQKICEEGLIKYPYSIRELAAVARHLEAYPQDGIRAALNNVFDFDRRDADTMELISEAFSQFGIQVGKQMAPIVIDVAEEEALTSQDLADVRRRVKEGPTEYEDVLQGDEERLFTSPKTRDVSYLLEREVRQQDHTSERKAGRISSFSEELVSFHASGNSSQALTATPASVVSSDGGSRVHVLSRRPEFVSTTGNIPDAVGETVNWSIGKLVGTGTKVDLRVLGNELILQAPKLGVIWRLNTDRGETIRMELPKEFLGQTVARMQGTRRLFRDASLDSNEMVLESEFGILRISKDFNELQFVRWKEGRRGAVLHSGEASSKSLSLPKLGLHVFQEGTSKLVAVDLDVGKKRTFDFGEQVVDFSTAGDDKIVALLGDGRVSVLELDRARTENALGNWLDMFGNIDSSFQSNLSIEVFDEADPNAHVLQRNQNMMACGGGRGASGIGGASDQGGPSSGGGGTGAPGGGGGGGSGPPVDRSDGMGGYTIDQMRSMSVEERLVQDLPITKQEAESLHTTGEQSIQEAILEEQARRQALKDLSLNPGGSDLFEEVKAKVSRQIKELKLILESAEAKEKERSWLQNKISGELNEEKIVDAIAGEPLVYRQRGTPDKKHSLFQQKPKRMMFVIDTSASMARANDDRLKHLIQAVVLLMESLDEFRTKFEYALTCHSGTSPAMPLNDFGEWPTLARRKEICNLIHAYARSAVTGDNTLQAAKLAIETVTAMPDPADDRFVVVLSDANLGRYSIRPEDFSSVLTADANVNAHAVFIAEASAADWMKEQLPLGHGHVCLDPARLPRVFADIFDAAVRK